MSKILGYIAIFDGQMAVQGDFWGERFSVASSDRRLTPVELSATSGVEAYRAAPVGLLATTCEPVVMEKLIHYADPMSRAMRSQTILDLFAIPHEKVLVEIRKGDHKKPEYGEIHPYRRVPALKHGDTVIVESGAIQLYLADLFPEKMNTPKPGTPERGLLYQWIFFLQTTLEAVVMPAFDASKRDEVRPKLRELLEAMATRFRGPFVLGSDFSVVDAILFCELSWYRMMEIFPTGLEPYESFMTRVQERMAAPVS